MQSFVLTPGRPLFVQNTIPALAAHDRVSWAKQGFVTTVFRKLLVSSKLRIHRPPFNESLRPVVLGPLPSVVCSLLAAAELRTSTDVGDWLRGFHLLPSFLRTPCPAIVGRRSFLLAEAKRLSRSAARTQAFHLEQFHNHFTTPTSFDVAFATGTDSSGRPVSIRPVFPFDPETVRSKSATIPFSDLCRTQDSIGSDGWVDHSHNTRRGNTTSSEE